MILKVEVKCPHCPERIDRVTTVSTRLELSRSQGVEIEERCPTCRKPSTHHFETYRTFIPVLWQLTLGLVLFLVIPLGITLFFLDLGWIVLTSVTVLPIFIAQRGWRMRRNAFNRS